MKKIIQIKSKLDRLLKKKSAHKSDKELLLNAYDAIPYKIIGGVINDGEIGLDFGDSPSEGQPLIYFIGGKNGYYHKSNLKEVSHEDFYEEDPGTYTKEDYKSDEEFIS